MDNMEETAHRFMIFRIGKPTPEAVTLVRIVRDACNHLEQALRQPFAVHMAEDARMNLRVAAATRTGSGAVCDAAYRAYEPRPVWSEEFLFGRATCYGAAHDPLATRAEADVLAFRNMRPPLFSPGL